ncbi:hypothetical protein [Flexithrix dorotheae]|uniref:hypothetical protein n=1 Tax=Flexithrix dorotheae TaxID=70993 RepID=UPI00037A09E0|nr:hypothetical protein [Flexithrix dorotheae]
MTRQFKRIWEVPGISKVLTDSSTSQPPEIIENELGDELDITGLSSINWFFGSGAGIRFASGEVKALPGGQINQEEGGYTVSDGKGNLLFYTDGINIFNRNHEVMEAGLFGAQSSATSAVVAVQPGTSLYWVFTVDENVGSKGMNYSIVDMNQNEGLGTVTEKNINLLPASNATEKIGMVQHQNGVDWWIVTHGFNNNNFYAYLLTKDGLNMNPVVSSAGIVYDYVTDKTGFIKDNFAQNRLAVSTYGGGGKAKVELFDFDNATGIISNPVDTGVYVNPYSIEFSPNDAYLYVGETPYAKNTWDKIYIYDIQAATLNTYWERTEDSTTPFHFGMQVAPDGKIYVSFNWQIALGVINNPNDPALSFIEFTPPMLTGPSRTGLPYYPKAYIDVSIWGEKPPNNTDSALFNIAFVDPNGDDLTAEVGRINRPFATFSEATDAVSEGGTVMVMPGVYTNHLQLNKQVNYHFLEGAKIEKTGLCIWCREDNLDIEITGRGEFISTNADYGYNRNKAIRIYPVTNTKIKIEAKKITGIQNAQYTSGSNGILAVKNAELTVSVLNNADTRNSGYDSVAGLMLKNCFLNNCEIVPMIGVNHIHVEDCWQIRYGQWAVGLNLYQQGRGSIVNSRIIVKNSEVLMVDQANWAVSTWGNTTGSKIYLINNKFKCYNSTDTIVIGAWRGMSFEYYFQDNITNVMVGHHHFQPVVNKARNEGFRYDPDLMVTPEFETFLFNKNF